MAEKKPMEPKTIASIVTGILIILGAVYGGGKLDIFQESGFTSGETERLAKVEVKCDTNTNKVQLTEVTAKENEKKVIKIEENIKTIKESLDDIKEDIQNINKKVDNVDKVLPDIKKALDKINNGN